MECLRPHHWSPQFQFRQERCPNAATAQGMWFFEWQGLSLSQIPHWLIPNFERAVEFAVRNAICGHHAIGGRGGFPRRMSQCPTVVAESGEIGMVHVFPRVSVVSCRGVAQRASMVHAPASSNRFAALVDDEVEVHHDSGNETVSMGDVEQVLRLMRTGVHQQVKDHILQRRTRHQTCFTQMKRE